MLINVDALYYIYVDHIDSCGREHDACGLN